jgi:hypothetical protein
MAAVSTYDPLSIVVTVGGVPMSGFTEGTFLEIARDEAVWSEIVGADGRTSRIRSNNNNATMTLTLKQTSPSNDILSGFLVADQISNNGYLSVMVKDLLGTSTFFSAQGWIINFPDTAYAKDILDREWSIKLTNIKEFVGGS